MSRHGTPAAQTGRRRILVTPDRADLVDAVLLVALMTLALLGFRTTYSGWLYLVAGLAGTLLGVVIAHFANVLRQPMIVVGVMALAVFFLAGGAVALRSTAIAGVLPSGATFSGLAHESVHGWKQLLTTLPPVDGGGPLLVLPYLLGVLGGAGGFCLARRTARGAAPVVVPLAVLVAVILLGTQTPAARLVQGAVFGTVALGWLAVRAQRRRPPIQTGRGRVSRAVTAGALLAVALVGGALLGPHVPGAGSHRRVVLRSYVQPPFDVGQYPSPLAGFRKYTKPAHQFYAVPLFTVTGLPAGTPVRIATMDDYDTLTWTAANLLGSPGQPPDTFQRVGTQITDPATGRRVSFTVTIDRGYSDVWLPDAGALTRLQFTGRGGAGHATYFRYDLATGTGVVPDLLQAGDSYRAQAVLPLHPYLRKTDVLASSGAAVAASSFLHTQATEWSGASPNATTRILALAQHLYSVGKYSDGEPPNQQYLPGHSQARLLSFVNGAQIVGDDEQYAAAYALMINQLGTPARVVLVGIPGRDGVVTGADVHAWVEVQAADGTWRDIPQSTFMNRDAHPTPQQPPQPQEQAGQIVPPPARIKPHSTLDDSASSVSHAFTTPRHTARRGGFRLPGWVTALGRWGGPPLLALALVCGIVVGGKALRRRRRRTRGSPATRLAKGWVEVVDHARDLGTAIPGDRTRREQAALLARHGVAPLAHAADAHVFGPLPPADADAHAYWSQVAQARKRMSRAAGRWRRLRAALSLASLRRSAPAEGTS